MILWGPPGTGKTTLASLLAAHAKAHFDPVLRRAHPGSRRSAAWSPQAEERLALRGQRTILFVDEIHRFNKAQQDAFLPHVERGTVTLIGATTENPSFEVIAALLSRCRVYVLERLTEAELETIVRRALADPERGLGPARRSRSTRTALAAIVGLSDGDARTALNILEVAARTPDGRAARARRAAASHGRRRSARRRSGRRSSTTRGARSTTT